MTLNQTKAEFERLLQSLVDANIAIDTNEVCVLGASASVQRVTWCASAPLADSLFRNDYSTVAEYRDWLTSRAYSAVLFDGAMLQLSFDFEGQDVIRHRLVYYPCPFEVDPPLFLELPLVDVIDLHMASPRDHARLVSPLRFDFDLLVARPDHPASHLTLLHANCRWPVASALALGDFIRFVFRQFYPALWSAHEFLRVWPRKANRRVISSFDETMMHVSCERYDSQVTREEATLQDVLPTEIGDRFITIERTSA